jgi:two-component system, response regulator YesN
MYKLLIVDDESLERMALRCIIKENIPSITDFEEAADGQEAVDKAREYQPHIIIMDIKMPRLDGIQAARKIKTYLPESRIILLSGYTYFSYARDAVSIGLYDFLVKPIGDEDLIESVQNVVDNLERELGQNSSPDKDDKKIRNLYNCLEEEFVSALVSREVEEAQLNRYLSTLEIGEVFYLGIILRDKNGKLTEGDKERQIREAGNLTFERDRLITVSLDNQIFMLLMLKEYRANLILRKQLKDFLVLLENNGGPIPQIYGGTIKRNPVEISESFHEARMIPSSKEQISFYQIPLSPSDKQFPINEEEELCEYLVRGDREGALSILGYIIQWIESNSNGLENFKIRIYELLIILNRRIRRELDPGDSTEYYDYLTTQTEKEEIKAYTIRTVRDLQERINRHYSSSSKVWKKHITLYIEENYRQTIGLEDLAEIAGFSAPYLSRIFKKEFGMSFTSYVNHLRIKDAKEMLNDQDLSIKEISFMLGFSDSNYFARVFKKETGINASQYKKSPNMTK